MRNRYIESLIALALFSVLAFGSDSSSSGGGSSSGSAAASISSSLPHAPTVDMQMPQGERDFCVAIAEAASAYDNARKAGANELKLSALRTARAHALSRTLHNRAAVKDWVGVLASLSTTGDGKAAIEVELPCGVQIGTWNNSLSDLGSNTLIPQSSKVYAALAEMQKGTPVRFSGKLVADDKDGFREKSMTEVGSMTEPNFVLAFSAAARR